MQIENKRIYHAASALMLEGKSSDAIEILTSIEPKNGELQRRNAALGCAYAILGQQENARRYLVSIEEEYTDNTSLSLKEAGFAYLSSHEGKHDEAAEGFKRAIEIDPLNPLPYYSLSLYHMWKNEDYQQAQDMLNQGLKLSPENPGLQLIHIALPAEEGNYKEALKRLRIADINSVSFARKTAVHFSLRLGGSPLRGGIVALVAGLMSMVPVFGPLIVLGWIAFSIIAFLELRRVSPRLAVLPSALLIVVLGVFILHSGLTGGFWP